MKPKVCPTCTGRGTVPNDQTIIAANQVRRIRFADTCPDCDGTGLEDDDD